MNMTQVRIIWAAMLASVGIYGGIVYFIQSSAVTPPLAVVQQALFAVAAVTGAAALFIRHRLAPQAPPDRARAMLIVSFALCEAVGIYGLMLHFLGAPRETALGLVFGAAVLLVLCFPRGD